MALTHSFEETVKKRRETDSEFRLYLLPEAINCLLKG